MLKNEQIICVGLPTWEGEYMKSTVQLMTELAKDNEVLYVDYPFTLKDLVTGLWKKGKAPVARMVGVENPLRVLDLENGSQVNVLTLPPVLPTNFIKNEKWYDRLTAVGAKYAGKAIRKAMKELNFKKPVVINAFNPFLGVHLANELDEKMLCYYCYDEIKAAKWCGRHGGRLEERFMKMADAVIFSSKPLLENKKHLAKQSFLVKNGVNFELFNQAIHQETPTTFLNEDTNKKVVGYLGSVDERLDYSLLKATITNSPDKLFVFVGRINDEGGREMLSKFSNVKMVGPQPPADLPKWVNLFDACLIPFAKNELTAGIYPLKINEYLAAGKPVITTNFGDLKDFENIVDIASNEQEFAAQIDTAVHTNSINSINDRVQFAFENSWEKRAHLLGEFIYDWKKETNKKSVKKEIEAVY